jgi:hypothetical protein
MTFTAGLTCPLIDDLVWVPFAWAAVTAVSIATAGVAGRHWPALRRTPDVLATVLVAGSLLAAVAILLTQATCG